MYCPFCDPKETAERALWQGKTVTVLLSNPRLVPGHVLVIPKRHVEKPSELNEEERREVFDTVLQIQDRILETYATGCDVRQHYRPFLPQGRTKVNHVHYHLHPRELEDPLYITCQSHERELWQDLTEEERETFTQVYKSPRTSE